MGWGKEKYWNVLSNLIKEFSLCLFSYGNSLSDFEEAGTVVWFVSGRSPLPTPGKEH